MKYKSILHPVYFAINPQGETVTPRAHGLDISKYDLFFHPEEATSQLDFVIQRISYRTTRDEKFLELVPGVMRVPIRGGYHYLSSDTDWRLQADKFISYVHGYDYHFFCCDFESAYNIMSVEFAYRAWQWINYVQGATGIPVILYTSLDEYNNYIFPSQSRYGINWNTIPLFEAQWFYVPNPNGTPTTPRGRTSGWQLWQYTSKGHGPSYGVARPTACDLDVFNGTVQAMKSYFHVTDTPPLEDVIIDEKGIKRVSSTRNNWKFELFISDPSRVRYESVCLSPLETVYSVVRRKGATLGVNGGEWDRVSQTKDYTVSNGQVCKPRVQAVPSLKVSKYNNAISINHQNVAEVEQALSGLRYLIRDGIIQSYLDGSEPQYTEGHARSIHGIDTNSYHMVLQSTGVYPNQGLTLKQAAELMKQYGAVTAFDSGGGGDVTCIFNGQSLIVPENPGGVERPLPNVFLIYTQTGVDMQYKVVWADGVRKRTAPTTSSTGGAVLAFGTVAEVVQDNIHDQTYPTDPYKLWCKFTDGTFGASIYGINSVRMIKVEETIPPPSNDYPESVTLNYTNGITKKYVPE